MSAPRPYECSPAASRKTASSSRRELTRSARRSHVRAAALEHFNGMRGGNVAAVGLGSFSDPSPSHEQHVQRRIADLVGKKS